MAKQTINSIPILLKYDDRIVFAADAAYDAKNTREFLKKKGFTPVISLNKRKSKTTEKVRSRNRWIIERTHAHLNKWRGIFIRWNKKVENYVAAIQIAATFYILKHL